MTFVDILKRFHMSTERDVGFGVPIPPLGRYRENAARNIRCIKRVDHTVLIATIAEDLQFPLDTL